jgi:hypothetical protein
VSLHLQLEVTELQYLAVSRNKDRGRILWNFYKSLDRESTKTLLKFHWKYSAFLEALTYVNILQQEHE